MTDHTGEQGTWLIGSRNIPLPAGASTVLQKAVENTPLPDVAESQKHPTNEAEWLANIAEGDKEMVAAIQDLIARSPISIKHDEIEGVNVYYVTPTDIEPKHQNHLFVYIHGGAYVYWGGEAGLGEAIYIALAANIPVLSIDYRMPPLHPFPAGLEDVIGVYTHLLSHRSPQSIALGGLSAGGGLAMAAIHRLIQLNIAVPGALYAGTPWSDLTKTGDSYWINEGIDRILVSYDGGLEKLAQMYAGGKDLRHPLLSPVYGDFQGFPATYLVTGTRDLFLSNTVRIHTKLRAAGVLADLLVFEGVAHADYYFEPDTPESQQAYAELKTFLRQHLQ